MISFIVEKLLEIDYEFMNLLLFPNLVVDLCLQQEQCDTFTIIYELIIHINDLHNGGEHNSTIILSLVM